jgi:transaldolase
MDNIVLDNQALGQSTWIDYIRRSMLTTGELGNLTHQGVTGLTSNPTIFEKAISWSDDYDKALVELAESGMESADVFETLVVEDIQSAADILRAVYNDTGSIDGYVSLELPPPIAHDTAATVREARRLFTKLRRPNVMIKVPATTEGVPAVRTLIGEGINVNVTLIFSLDVYRKVIEAYVQGIEDLVTLGKNPSGVASVASFFVSRVDTAVDRLLRALQGTDDLLGKAAIANAQAAYAISREIFASSRFAALRTKGAQVQRPLWASTSTKDPSFPDTLYVDNLVGPDTVNTMPPDTLKATLDHGHSAVTLNSDGAEAQATLAAISGAGIDMEEVTEKLLRDGVAAFAKSYDDVLVSIDSKRNELARIR